MPSGSVSSTPKTPASPPPEMKPEKPSKPPLPFGAEGVCVNGLRVPRMGDGGAKHYRQCDWVGPKSVPSRVLPRALHPSGQKQPFIVPTVSRPNKKALYPNNPTEPPLLGVATTGEGTLSPKGSQGAVYMPGFESIVFG
jgi:hypothetical protein